jgi:hypothetical protein
VFACSGVISTPAYSGDGHLRHTCNFDFDGGESFGQQQCVTLFRRTEGIPFASVAWPGLSGAVTGMNRERLGHFLLAAATLDFRRKGSPAILMARAVLQHARTIEETLAFMDRTGVFGSDILVLADGKSGRAVIVEKSRAVPPSLNRRPSRNLANG